MISVLCSVISAGNQGVGLVLNIQCPVRRVHARAESSSLSTLSIGLAKCGALRAAFSTRPVRSRSSISFCSSGNLADQRWVESFMDRSSEHIRLSSAFSSLWQPVGYHENPGSVPGLASTSSKVALVDGNRFALFVAAVIRALGEIAEYH